MPDVTISSTTTQLKWQGGADAPKLIVEASAPFFTAGGIPVNSGGGPFRGEWTTSINGSGYVVVPAVTLPSTEDSSVPTVTYFAYFQKANAYDPASRTPYATFGAQRGFRVPASPTTTTWQDLDDNMGGTFASAPADKTIGGDLIVGGLLTADFAEMPDAPGYKVNGTQVIGEQGDNIPDPDGTLAGNTAVLQQVVDFLRGWGAVSDLFTSTLNGGLISLWLMGDTTDAAGSNDLTNTGGVTFDSNGANFSGSNHLTIANNSTLQIPTYQSFTFAVRVRLDTKATSQALVSKTDGGTANEFSMVYVSLADGFDRFRFNVYVGGTVLTGVTASSLGSPSTATDYLVIGWYDVLAHTVNIQVNNGATDSAAATVTAHAYTAQLAIGSLSVPTPSLRLDGSIRFVGFWNRVLETEERTELYDNQNALAYPLKDDSVERTTFHIQPYNLYDNRAVAYAGAEAGGYFYSLPFARAAFTTSATSMDVEVFTNESEIPASARYVNVRVNGADYDLITVPSSAGAVTTHTVSLPVGSKTVEVWAAFQTLLSGTVKGTWLRKITFSAPAVIKTPTNGTPHMVVYGDSIATGAGATEPPRGGWTMLLRDDFPGTVAVEGWGGRSLFQDAPNAPARAVLVQRIATQEPDVIWLAIGTNDYGGVGFGEQSAADFGTAYAALLDDLHTALPDAEIYAQSPIPRTSEAANTFGNTLGNYRTQIQTACALRAWATFVDGTTIPTFNTGTDLYDTVHPNDAGHAKYADFVKGYFGL